MTTTTSHRPAARHHGLLALVIGLLLTVTLLAPGATAQPAPSPSTEPAPAPQPGQTGKLVLPAPTGPQPTGTARIHLMDPFRADPYDPTRRRELMVQLYYPASPGGQPLAPYAPPQEADRLEWYYGTPDGAFDVPTNSLLRARMAPGRHPVVFFHHGLCAARTDSTIVAEELASHGYVVVMMGATGESAATEFPDGRLVADLDPEGCAAGADPYGGGAAKLEQLLDVRVADVRFTATALVAMFLGLNPDVDGTPLPKGMKGSMNVWRMGIYGHSFGGATAAAVLAKDWRFAAGADLDGFIIGPVATQGLAKPFLVVGSSYHDPQMDPSWATFLPALTGWWRWFQITNAGHYRFIDMGGSVTALGLDAMRDADPVLWAQIFGDLPDAQSQLIMRGLVTAFFDKHLRGKPAPVLDDPTAVYPEVVDRTGEIG